jgi:hypothetical protein
MNQTLRKIAIPGLRWVLGLVVLLESYQFAFSPSATAHFANTGLPQWIRPALAGSEIIAVLVFLLSAASFLGGYLLLFFFLIAAVLHILHGEFNIGALVVYAAAVIVCMTQPREEAAEVPHDR